MVGQPVAGGAHIRRGVSLPPLGRRRSNHSSPNTVSTGLIVLAVLYVLNGSDVGKVVRPIFIRDENASSLGFCVMGRR